MDPRAALFLGATLVLAHLTNCPLCTDPLEYAKFLEVRALGAVIVLFLLGFPLLSDSVDLLRHFVPNPPHSRTVSGFFYRLQISRFFPLFFYAPPFPEPHLFPVI